MLRRLTGMMVIVACLASAGVAAATAQSTRTPGAWLALQWRWRAQFPAVNRHATTCIRRDQPAGAWLLGAYWHSATGSVAYTLHCAVPAGRSIVAPVYTADCSTLEPPPFHASTDTGLVRCAKREWFTGRIRGSVRLDGRLQSFILTATRAFAFTIPARNNVERAHGATHGRAALYGEIAILPTLSPGVHRLVMHFTYGTHAWNDVTVLTVS